MGSSGEETRASKEDPEGMVVRQWPEVQVSGVPSAHTREEKPHARLRTALGRVQNSFDRMEECRSRLPRPLLRLQMGLCHLYRRLSFRTPSSLALPKLSRITSPPTCDP